MGMNIIQLKELIKDLPDEMPIVVDGYERGIKAVEKTDIIDIYDYKNDTTLYGEFIDKEDQSFVLENERGNLTHISKAFYLSREYLNEYKYD
jgi:hypothetical protein